MAYSILNTIDAGQTAATAALTSGSYTLTSGSRLILIACMAASIENSSSVTDTLGNSYSKVTSSAFNNAGGNGMSYVAWECRQTTSGGAVTLTLNLSASSTQVGFCGFEISGLDPASAVQVLAKQQQAAPGTGTDAITCGSLTPTGQPAMVFGYDQAQSENTYSVAGTGFNTAHQCPNCSVVNGTSRTVLEDRRITSTAVLTNGASFTTTVSASNVTYGIIISEYVAPSAFQAMSCSVIGSSLATRF